MSPLVIIKDLLTSGVAKLEGLDNAVLNAELLLKFVLGVSREYLLAHFDEDVGPALADLFFAYIERVSAGEPVEYILQEKEFFGLKFFVDNRVLIPRPETEMLVERVLDYLRSNAKGGRRIKVLDVGTGSGNIAVSVARQMDVDQLDVIDEFLALDIDKGAIEVAKINVLQHGVENTVQVALSDLLDVLDEEESYDVIVANLPYIGRVKNKFVSASAEKFEPELALFGGEDGTELYKKMFQELADKKIDFKLLIGEFGFGQSKDMGELLSKYFDQKWRIEKDLAGIDRIFIVNN